MMGQARKFIDLAFDFIILVVGLAILIGGMDKVNKMQDEELERTLNGGGRLTYVSDSAQECSGSEVISFLLGRDYVPVELNGITYASHERMVLIGLIVATATYDIQRQYVSGEYGAPSKIVLVKK